MRHLHRVPKLNFPMLALPGFTLPKSALPMLALALCACGQDHVTYDTPDSTVWASRERAACTPSDGGVALVTNNGSDTVSLLDLAGQRVLGTYPVGITPLANNGPHHAVIDTVANTFYLPLAFPAPAILPGPHAAHGSSGTPGIVIQRSLCDMHLMGQVQVDPNPGDLVLSSDRQRVYVSHYDLVRATQHVGNRDAQLSTVAIIDTAAMRVVARVPTCIAGHGMALSADGNTLYVACYGDDALAILTPLHGDNPTVTLVPVGASLANGNPTYGPYAIGLAPDGNTVWVGTTPPDPRSTGTGPMFALDVRSQRFDGSRTIRRLPGNPYFPAFSRDGTTMLIPTQNRDTVVRVHLGVTSDLGTTMAYGNDCILPHQVALGPDGLYYVACEGIHTGITSQPGQVLSLDPTDLHIVSRFPVQVYPEVVVFGGRQP